MGFLNAKRSRNAINCRGDDGSSMPGNSQTPKRKETDLQDAEAERRASKQNHEQVPICSRTRTLDGQRDPQGIDAYRKISHGVTIILQGKKGRRHQVLRKGTDGRVIMGCQGRNFPHARPASTGEPRVASGRVIHSLGVPGGNSGGCRRAGSRGLGRSGLRFEEKAGDVSTVPDNFCHHEQRPCGKRRGHLQGHLGKALHHRTDSRGVRVVLGEGITPTMMRKA